MASIDSDSIQPVKASGFCFNLSFIIYYPYIHLLLSCI